MITPVTDEDLNRLHANAEAAVQVKLDSRFALSVIAELRALRKVADEFEAYARHDRTQTRWTKIIAALRDAGRLP